MRLLSSTLLAIALALAGAPVPALAATAAEARVQAQQSREQSLAIRAQQSRLREELNGVATRIEDLKARQPGRLLPGGELPELLRRSQELSDSLTQLASALARAEAESESAGAALAEALSQELDQARSAFDRTQDRGQRRALLGQLRALRRERDQVRAGLPGPALPTLRSPAGADDDPEDLLEQADALRDTQDKVSGRIRALDRRLDELRQERELDRRMGEFLDEDLAFDERDRRFRQGPGGGIRTTADMAAPGGAQSTGPGGDGVPRVGVKDGVTTGGGEDELSALARQRAQLESMAAELGQQAEQLERKARELER